MVRCHIECVTCPVVDSPEFGYSVVQSVPCCTKDLGIQKAALVHEIHEPSMQPLTMLDPLNKVGCLLR